MRTSCSGAAINDLINIPVREDIGRYKYTEEANIKAEYERIMTDLARQVSDALGKGAN